MDDPLPIEIRPGEYVWIQGIPFDLTWAEASKISKVVLALARESAAIAPPDNATMEEV